jgi:hypothetical protein
MRSPDPLRQGGPAIPPGTGYPFSRILRRVLVTVGLFFNPGHHTGLIYIFIMFYLGAWVAQSVKFLVTDWTTGRSRFDPWQRQDIFPVASVSRPALGPTQPPVQWVPAVLSPGVKHGRGVRLSLNYRHLGAYCSSPSWHMSMEGYGGMIVTE